MLEYLLSRHHDQLSTLAGIWLTEGATSFEIWDDDTRLLACWPAGEGEGEGEGTGNGSPPQPATLVQPIQHDSTRMGEVRVAGLDTPVARARLHAYATLLAYLVRLELEQEDMVADLIEVQDQLITVYELTQSVCYQSYFTEVDQLLRCLVSEVARLLKVDRSFLLLETPQRTRLVCHPASSDGAIPHSLLVDTRFGTSDLIVNREDSMPFPLPDSVENLLYVPIQVRDDIRAGLGLVNKPGGFASPELKLARAIAEQTASRIENFLLHQETLEQTRLQTEAHMARQIQRRLLPQSLPELPGLALYADWRPARHASGDFYDFIVRRDHPFLFTVGDVSGKGMPAALITVETMTEIRSQARILLDPTPAAILRCTNESLYNDLTRAEMLATVFIGHYDPDCHELRYANAGHSPVIYCPARPASGEPAEPQLLKADGPPLGVLPDIAYTNQSLVLHAGDIVLVATDGFHEAFNATGEMFGYERLLKLVGEVRDLSPQEIVEHLFAAVEQFTGRTHTADDSHTLSDDQAIIVLKSTGTDMPACTIRQQLIRLDLPASFEYLDVLGLSIEAMFKREQMGPAEEKMVYSKRLVLHELCTNIVEHAYAGEQGHIGITLTLAPNPRRLVAELYDTGQPFDPSRVPEPEPLGDRGRGLSLIRSVVDEVRYYARTNQVWQSRGGQPWQPIRATHPQPGRNYWYLVMRLRM